MKSVILRSKVGDFEINTSLGGRQQVQFKWNKENGFLCEVPTEWKYFNTFNQEVIAHRNYAQFLLDNYPESLAFAEEAPEGPPVVEPAPRKRGRPPKVEKEQEGSDETS